MTRIVVRLYFIDKGHERGLAAELVRGVSPFFEGVDKPAVVTSPVVNTAG